MAESAATCESDAISSSEVAGYLAVLLATACWGLSGSPGEGGSEGASVVRRSEIW